MKHSFILWTSAFLLTFLSGYFRSGLSEYYPVTGTIGINEKKVSYRFEKIYDGEGDYTFIIRTDNPEIDAVLKWKSAKDTVWKGIMMKNKETVLTADIPRQKAGEEILYYAAVKANGKEYTLPDKPVKLLFRGYVPPMISFLNTFALFGGLLLGIRTGLEIFNENRKIKKLTLFTLTFFFVYTIAVAPLRKSFELDAINKKVVNINSLFDLQSVLLLLIWIAALVLVFKLKNPKPAALFFSLVTILVFLFAG